MTLHIYRTNAQPRTRWRLGPEIMDPPSPWFTCSPHKRERCDRCYRKREARNLEVYAYYDHIRVGCAGECAPSTYKERQARLREWRREDRAARNSTDAPNA